MRQRRRRHISQDAPRGIGSQLLGLSMFVMLLAFFMVLNSISSYEDKKVEDVRQSMGDTFAASLATESDIQPAITRSEELQPHEGDTLEMIEGLFKAEIAGYSVVKNKQRGIVMIQVPRQEFELAVDSVGKTQKTKGFSAAFLPTLVSLMRADGRGAPYQMDVTYYMEENPARVQNQEPRRMSDAIRAVSGIARKIEIAGLPARLMTIGLQKGDPETVDLIFRRHQRYEPDKVNPEQGEGSDDRKTPTP